MAQTEGICRLCGITALLHDSHIFPKAGYRRILEGPERLGQPVRVTPETSVVTNWQMKERLLCGSCEGLFSKWETYACPLVAQADDSFPWLEKVRRGSGEVADSSAVDVEPLSLFFSSIFWRLSVHTGSQIELGPYESPLGRYLLRQASFPENARLIIILLDPSKSTLPRVDRSFGDFEPTRVSGNYHAHRFVFFGVDARLYVGARLPKEHEALCFPRTRRVLVRSSEHLEEELGAAFLKSKPKGKLAAGYAAMSATRGRSQA